MTGREKEIVAKGAVLMEFRYPVSMLVAWLIEQASEAPIRVRYRAACGPYVKAENISRDEAGLLVHECRRHGTERVKVQV